MIKSVQMLQTSKLFQGVDPDLLNKLITSKQVKLFEFHKGSVIHFRNETCSRVEVIVKGNVEISNLDENGGYFTLTKLYPGDIMGAGIVFSTSGKYPFTVVALDDVVILSVHGDLLLDISNSDPQFTRKLLRLISDKTDSLTGWISGIYTRSIRENLIDYLLLQSNIQGSTNILIDSTKTELAARFGVNRSSLGRVFKDLKMEGLIEVNGRKISIKSLKHMDLFDK